MLSSHQPNPFLSLSHFNRMRDPRTNRLSPNSVVAWKQSSPSSSTTQVVPPAPAPPPYSLIHYYCGNPMVEVAQGVFLTKFVYLTAKPCDFGLCEKKNKLTMIARPQFWPWSSLLHHLPPITQEFSIYTRLSCLPKSARKWSVCCPFPRCWRYTIFLASCLTSPTV